MARARAVARRPSGCSTAASAPADWRILGATEEFADVNFVQADAGTLLHPSRRCCTGAAWSCSATTPTRRSSAAGIDPIGKKVRIGAVEYTVIGVLGKRPSVGGFGNGQDDFVVIPQTTHQVHLQHPTRPAARLAGAEQRARS